MHLHQKKLTVRDVQTLQRTVYAILRIEAQRT